MQQDSVGLTHRCNLQRVAPVLENRPRGFPKSVIIQKYPLTFGNGYVLRSFCDFRLPVNDLDDQR